MGTVDAGFAVSLDGFVADGKDDISALYAWMVGAVEQNTPLDDMELTEHGEETQQSRSTELGAIVSGRRTFDLAKGWGGRHPLGVPVVVLTHEVPTEWANDGNPFTFVTGGVKEAIATASVSPTCATAWSATEQVHRGGPTRRQRRAQSSRSSRGRSADWVAWSAGRKVSRRSSSRVASVAVSSLALTLKNRSTAPAYSSSRASTGPAGVGVRGSRST